jgi:hypothetical protein
LFFHFFSLPGQKYSVKHLDFFKIASAARTNPTAKRRAIISSVQLGSKVALWRLGGCMCMHPLGASVTMVLSRGRGRRRPRVDAQIAVTSPPRPPHCPSLHQSIVFALAALLALTSTAAAAAEPVCVQTTAFPVTARSVLSASLSTSKAQATLACS